VETAPTLPRVAVRARDRAGRLDADRRAQVRSPLGTDLGVAMGRIAELGELRLVGVVGLAILVVGMLLAGIEALAYHERVAIARGLAVGLLVAGCSHLAGQPWRSVWFKPSSPRVPSP